MEGVIVKSKLRIYNRNKPQWMIMGTTWHAMQMTFKLTRDCFVETEGRVDECAGGWGSMMSIIDVGTGGRLQNGCSST